MKNPLTFVLSALFICSPVFSNVLSLEGGTSKDSLSPPLFLADRSVATNSNGRVIRSGTDLGWQAGQDITAEFKHLFESGTLGNGDTLILQHMYKSEASDVSLPDDFILAGETIADGITITNYPDGSKQLIHNFGHRNTLYNLTIDTGADPSTVATNNLVGLWINGKDDLSIVNSHIRGFAKTLLRTGNSKRLFVKDTHFQDSFYQMLWGGTNRDHVVVGSLFSDAVTDGIKTARGGENTRNIYVSDSVFIKNRDGIDTTGGFQDSLVKDSYFINNRVSAFDFKTIVERIEDIGQHQHYTNSNIEIRNVEMIGPQTNLIVNTYLERNGVPVPEEIRQTLIPHNIRVYDSLFENHKLNAGFSTSFLNKNAYNLSSVNNTYLGNLRVPDESSSSFSGGTLTGTTLGEARPYKGDAYYRSLAGPDRTITYDGGPIPVDGPTNPNPPSGIAAPKNLRVIGK